LKPAHVSLLVVVLTFSACRREEHAPAPSPSASAAGKNFTEQARERHLQAELQRARDRWQAKPGLGECAPPLEEKADLALCQAAKSALAAISAEPEAAPERALALLEPGALALARLSQRVRYLSLAELAQRRLQGDAGAGPAPAPVVSGSVAGATAALARSRQERRTAHPEGRALELREGPIAQLLTATIRAERDVLRALGAYLEYAPLPVRRTALAAAKRLHDEHPQWPQLDRLLREAAVLESDVDLKQQLSASAESGLPRSRPGQSPETK